MSYVIEENGKYKEMTNLGWLLRHYDEVELFAVQSNAMYLRLPTSRNHYRLWKHPDSLAKWDCWLIAKLKNDRHYATGFMDSSVLMDWLHRPKFRGLTCLWFGWSVEI